MPLAFDDLDAIHENVLDPDCIGIEPARVLRKIETRIGFAHANSRRVEYHDVRMPVELESPAINQAIGSCGNVGELVNSLFERYDTVVAHPGAKHSG